MKAMYEVKEIIYSKDSQHYTFYPLVPKRPIYERLAKILI